MTHMRRAVELARQALGSTSPNPAVGAVIAKDGVEVGRGITQTPGRAHAEIGAIAQAGTQARGATLYVTLEPCCTWGRTPPCTGAIIEAGISTVYAAAIDPNPDVSGKGLAELQAAGVSATVVLEPVDGLKELYEGFSKHINTGLPFVTAKFAMSLDGKIATHTGDSKWVTGPPARNLVQEIRREADGILVGVRTALADDPLLTTRNTNGQPLERQPLRVILDSKLRTPPTSQMLRQPGTTVVYTREDAPKVRALRLESSTAEVVRLPSDTTGRVDLPKVLADLGSRGVVNLIVEGGGTVLGSFFDQELVDKIFAFVSPVVVGGSGATTPVRGLGAATMDSAWRIQEATAEPIGDDWLITGYLPTREQLVSALDLDEGLVCLPE